MKCFIELSFSILEGNFLNITNSPIKKEKKSDLLLLKVRASEIDKISKFLAKSLFMLVETAVCYKQSFPPGRQLDYIPGLSYTGVF